MAEVGNTGLLGQCAWCLAVRVDGEYRRCPAIPMLNRRADNVTHGICPACVARLAMIAQVGRVAVNDYPATRPGADSPGTGPGAAPLPGVGADGWPAPVVG